MAKKKKTRSLKKLMSVTTKPLDWNGDHGTGTQAAIEGTEIIPLHGNNPNRFARRVRRPQSDVWKPRLSLRQYQAAEAIELAYCRVMTLSSGGALKEFVDASPKPDAVVSAQVDAASRLQQVMSPIQISVRPVIEHLFWHNKPLSDFGKGRGYYNRMAEVLVALDLVANKLRY